ncbi:hypothetical protein DVH24_038835 [Malus domestica]|uniref:Pentacotripeptide-repeat region of PRORP domain-containing protein n=1 Tax=Malus domestica TaxID=3750 RepID=A0A498KAU1_MALDO|nr:hypothetical protein DVH24_038835 [Malus domestica]
MITGLVKWGELELARHGGLMDKGLNFFRKMIDKYEMALDIKHYSCLIDMLMRAGRLKVAEKNGFGDSVQYC